MKLLTVSKMVFNEREYETITNFINGLREMEADYNTDIEYYCNQAVDALENLLEFVEVPDNDNEIYFSVDLSNTESGIEIIKEYEILPQDECHCECHCEKDCEHNETND